MNIGEKKLLSRNARTRNKICKSWMLWKVMLERWLNHEHQIHNPSPQILISKRYYSVWKKAQPWASRSHKHWMDVNVSVNLNAGNPVQTHFCSPSSEARVLDIIFSFEYLHLSTISTRTVPFFPITQTESQCFVFFF